MKHIKYFSLIILITFISCHSKNEKYALGLVSSYDDEYILQMEQPQEFPVSQNGSFQMEQKLIKEGWVEFETSNIGSTREIIYQVVKQYKGYISSDEEYQRPFQKSNKIILRIPAENFDSFLIDATAEVKHFDKKEINIKDVTEEFLDIEARLKTKKELENRYLELLQKAKNVSEMLEIEKQIGILRADIESMEGRMKYLQNEVSFSSITLFFYEKDPEKSEFGQKIRTGLQDGWNYLVEFFVFLLSIWPFLLLIILCVFIIKRTRKQRRIKREKKQDANIS